MKIEKINDNQIRCTLNRQDLQDRELKISELAYGTQKAKDLFHDMIEQADEEFGFSADDMPLMIEAIPVSVDCIVLIITKVDDPEELDTRFSKFAPSENDGEGTEAMDSEDSFHDMEEIEGLDGEFNIAPEVTEEKDSKSIELPADTFIPFAEALHDIVEKFASGAGSAISDFIKNVEIEMPDVEDSATNANDETSVIEDGESQIDEENTQVVNSDDSDENAQAVNSCEDDENAQAVNSDESDENVNTAVASESEEETEEAKKPEEVLMRIFSFSSWDEASHAACNMNVTFGGESQFFKDTRNGCYYLTITGSASDKTQFYAVSNELTEYGRKLKPTYATGAYLSEHCTPVIRANALQILKEY